MFSTLDSLRIVYNKFVKALSIVSYTLTAAHEVVRSNPGFLHNYHLSSLSDLSYADVGPIGFRMIDPADEPGYRPLQNIYESIYDIALNVRELYLHDAQSAYSYQPVRDISKHKDNSTRLEEIDCKDEWIPDEYKCPITRFIINGTPVYTQSTPHRFGEVAILLWLQNSKQNPVNRSPLSPLDLRYDYILAGKIKVFIELIRSNIFTLHNLSPALAQAKVNVYLANINKQFAKFDEHSPTTSVQQFTSELLKTVKENVYARNVATFFSRPKPVVKTPNDNQQDHHEVSEFLSHHSDAYEVLNIPRASSEHDIEKAYKKQALFYHPDKNKNPNAAESFKVLSAAKNILTNPKQKLIHDEMLLQRRQTRRLG